MSETSESLFARAVKLMPGGVSSPVRAFGSVGGTPRYFSRGEGASVVDEDGRRYTDYCMAWGPLILGHAHPVVIDAVTRAARDGLAFGTCHRHEPKLAELVLEAFPFAERVRFVVSGTEAVLTALRLARAHTGRKLLLKFSGCYHGHADAMLVKAGSGVATLGLAESEGVTVANDTLVAPLGDVEALERTFAEYGSQLAAVIIEPLPANNGLLIQDPHFLARLRELTRTHGTQLIFDEVISGFRFGFHGYGRLLGIEPDLTTLGKIVGGGLPVGAIVGKKEVLERLAPLGRTYQAGTMAGNPVALAAGIATLEVLRAGEPYRQLEKLSRTLKAAVQARKDRAFQLVQTGSLFWPYYRAEGPAPTRAEQVEPAAVAAFKERYHRWLDAGIYLPPSAWEVGFLSSAHTTEDVERLAAAL
ncbi:MAG: glutamate-1-semialdehyde 2,1-aminomutase [Myxococcaceae bacterium]